MAGTVTLDTLCLDVEKAPKTALGQLDTATIKDVWWAHCHFIHGRLTAGNAVRVLNFGLFTFRHEDGPSGRALRLPVFEVSDRTAAACNVSKPKAPATAGKAPGTAGKARVVDLNPSAIGAEMGIPRDVVTTVLRSLYHALQDRVRSGAVVQVVMNPLGTLLSRADKLPFRFTAGFQSKISGEPAAALAQSSTWRPPKVGGSTLRQASPRRHSNGVASLGASRNSSRASSRASSRGYSRGSSRASQQSVGISVSGSSAMSTPRSSRPSSSMSGASTDSHASFLRAREDAYRLREEARQREIELDMKLTQDAAAATARAQAADREKHEKMRQQRNAEARYNIETLAKQQQSTRNRFPGQPMGDIFSGRQSPPTDAQKKLKLQQALDEQIRYKQDVIDKEKKDDLDFAIQQRKQLDKELEEEEMREREARREAQLTHRRELEEQMRRPAPRVQKSHDAIDTNFTASEGPAQVAARKRRALELQKEQRALMAGRDEIKKFERKQEADLAEKEAHEIKSYLAQEKQREQEKKDAMKASLRTTWDQQIEDRLQATALEKHGQEKSLTSLNIKPEPSLRRRKKELAKRKAALAALA